MPRLTVVVDSTSQTLLWQRYGLISLLFALISLALSPARSMAQDFYLGDSTIATDQAAGLCEASCF